MNAERSSIPAMAKKLECLSSEELAVVDRVLQQLEINRTAAQLTGMVDTLEQNGVIECLPEWIAELRSQRTDSSPSP